MRFTELSIQNYKGLRDIRIPLSAFVCLIGENNAGKSSALQSLSLFFSGSAVTSSLYFDPTKDIRIEVTIDDIGADDLNLLAEEHRTKIAPLVASGKLRLVRSYSPERETKLRYVKMLPTEERFSAQYLDDLLKGRVTAELRAKVAAAFPELAGQLDAISKIDDLRAKVMAVADGLPDDQKEAKDIDLPTGLDKSIKPMLPECIYIPAVKDLRDDVKTADSAPFGKVLGILLKAIEPQLANEQALFEGLHAKLNRVKQADGSFLDNRLEPVRKIEDTVQQYVRESFSNVSLRITIPPPELKTVLSAAQIFADDGVDGLIDSKGDGLRRAIVFAVLRSFVELSKSGVLAGAQASAARYLLLFEEPELYLHPRAQQVLFETLCAFSTKHPVVVTTHSPTFFGPCGEQAGGTTTFVKMRKTSDIAVAPRPYSTAHAIDVTTTTGRDARDHFQIICYENNNIAFFSDRIALVEGDSDIIAFPHLAIVINPEWDCGTKPVRFARIGGKANIRRYKTFFSRFNARVFVITDLDFLLGSEFSQIDPPAELVTLRDQLLAATDKVLEAAGPVPEPNSERVKKAHEKGDLRALWRKARQLQADHKDGKATLEQVAAAVDAFFAWEKYWGRRDLIAEASDATVKRLKQELLTGLRKVGVCVLEKGALDDYYPADVTGDGKPAKAQAFCTKITTKAQALALCSSGHPALDGRDVSEFEAIFDTVFHAS